MSRKIAIYISSCSVSQKNQQDSLVAICMYEKVEFDIFKEDDRNVTDRRIRTTMIAKLKYEYKSVYAYSIECMFNDVNDFILIAHFLINEKRNFFIKEERLNYTWDLGYGNLTFVKSLYNLYNQKENQKRKEAEAEEFIIEEFNCLGKCNMKDDIPHAV